MKIMKLLVILMMTLGVVGVQAQNRSESESLENKKIYPIRDGVGEIQVHYLEEFLRTGECRSIEKTEYLQYCDSYRSVIEKKIVKTWFMVDSESYDVKFSVEYDKSIALWLYFPIFAIVILLLLLLFPSSSLLSLVYTLVMTLSVFGYLGLVSAGVFGFFVPLILTFLSFLISGDEEISNINPKGIRILLIPVILSLVSMLFVF